MKDYRLENLAVELKKHQKGKKILIITDTNVSKLYMDKIKSLPNLNEFQIENVVLNAGESIKSWKTVIYITEKLASLGFSMDDGIIALGGGTVGDLAAFVASIYKRGIKLYMIPTTLLSMVDSSIGGKTAINTEYGKNQIGTFYEANFRILEIDFLKTLPQCEYKSGLAEVIKYSFLQKSIMEYGEKNGCISKLDSLMDILEDENNKMNQMENIIGICSHLKRTIIEIDPYDKGIRHILNLGHTFGHSIEKISEYMISHGEAVAIGMGISANIGRNLGITTEENYDKILEILLKYDLGNNEMIDLDGRNFIAELIRVIETDKKVKGDNISLIIPESIGKVRIYTMSIIDLNKKIYRMIN